MIEFDVYVKGLEQVVEQATRALRVELSDLMNELYGLSAGSKLFDAPTVLKKRKVADKLGATADKRVDKAFRTIYKDLTSMMERVAVAQQGILLDELRKRGIKPTSPYTDSKLAAEGKNTLVVGLLLGEWLERSSLKVKQEYRRALNRTILLARDESFLRTEIKGTRSRASLVSVARRDLEATARTAIYAAANAAMLLSMRKQRRALKGFEPRTKLDSKTTPLCRLYSSGSWALDGTKLPESTYDGSFPGPPPWHYNCRTYLVPILKKG